MEGNVLHDSVALVEDAEDRDALGHGRDARLARRSGPRLVADCIPLLRLLAAAARGDGQREQQNDRALHCYSGIQGS
jgi:hypothetical protein